MYGIVAKHNTTRLLAQCLLLIFKISKSYMYPFWFVGDRHVAIESLSKRFFY